uniref:Uncharacterized protein n=1 Tax=Anopheles merus TaxID=30066 RepID=A0A182VKY7_ANOME
MGESAGHPDRSLKATHFSGPKVLAAFVNSESVYSVCSFSEWRDRHAPHARTNFSRTPHTLTSLSTMDGCLLAASVPLAARSSSSSSADAAATLHLTAAIAEAAMRSLPLGAFGSHEISQWREFYPARRLDERNPHCTAGRTSAASHVLISEAVELILAMVLACAFTGFAVHLTMRSSSPPAYRRIVPAQMIGPHVAGPYTGEKVEFCDKARTAAPDQRICPTPGDNAPREG